MKVFLHLLTSCLRCSSYRLPELVLGFWHEPPSASVCPTALKGLNKYTFLINQTLLPILSSSKSDLVQLSPLFLHRSRAAERPEFTMGSSSRIVVDAVENYNRKDHVKRKGFTFQQNCRQWGERKTHICLDFLLIQVDSAPAHIIIHIRVWLSTSFFLDILFKVLCDPNKSKSSRLAGEETSQEGRVGMVCTIISSWSSRLPDSP